MGALGNCLVGQGFYGELVRSTNTEDFVGYLEHLREHVNCAEKPYLLLDNASAHHAKKARPLLEQYFRPLFIPRYSCRFNSVEILWARIKASVRATHTKFLFSREHTREHMMALVEVEYTENIPTSIYTNIFRSNRAYVNSLLPEEQRL